MSEETGAQKCYREHVITEEDKEVLRKKVLETAANGQLESNYKEMRRLFGLK